MQYWRQSNPAVRRALSRREANKHPWTSLLLMRSPLLSLSQKLLASSLSIVPDLSSCLTETIKNKNLLTWQKQTKSWRQFFRSSALPRAASLTRLLIRLKRSSDSRVLTPRLKRWRCFHQDSRMKILRWEISRSTKTSRTKRWKSPSRIHLWRRTTRASQLSLKKTLKKPSKILQS